MGKRILVLTASGRKHGNTEAMAEAFIDAAADKGHILTKIDTAFEAVKPCYDCKGCFKTPMEACCCDDTFNKKIRAAVTAKVPNILVVGAKEMEEETVTWRRYSVKEQRTLKFAQFQAILDKMYRQRVMDNFADTALPEA